MLDPVTSTFRLTNIPHYHGDLVRGLFVAAAIVSFIAIPMVGDLLPFGTLAQVLFSVVLVLLAGLTHPHGRMLMYINAAAAGLGAFLYELTALLLYESSTLQLFLVRVVAGGLLLLAFYFAVKTARAMTLGTVGKLPEKNEFDRPAPPVRPDSNEW